LSPTTLLDLVAASTEQIAIWILMALKEEWERDPSHLTCRTGAIVLGPLESKHAIEDADITRGMRFLIDRRMLDAVNREDGRATLPNALGLEHLAAHEAAQKREVERKQDVRLKIYPIIIAILALVIAFLGYKIWK